MKKDNVRELRLEKFAINQNVLDKYGIEFSLSEVHYIYRLIADVRIIVKSTKIISLHSFLYYNFPVNLEELLEEMDKAMNNEEFDKEAWYDVTGTIFLDIGPINCELGSNIIPTNDLKEIFSSYIYWIDSNNYEKYI